MSTAKMREALRDVYPNDKWRWKVDHMSEEQVIAVFMRLKKQNKI